MLPKYLVCTYMYLSVPIYLYLFICTYLGTGQFYRLPKIPTLIVMY